MSVRQAGLSSEKFSANSAGIGLIRNCSAALVPVLADKMEQLFQCVVMPTYAMSESGLSQVVSCFLFDVFVWFFVFFFLLFLLVVVVVVAVVVVVVIGLLAEKWRVISTSITVVLYIYIFSRV